MMHMLWQACPEWLDVPAVPQERLRYKHIHTSSGERHARTHPPWMRKAAGQHFAQQARVDTTHLGGADCWLGVRGKGRDGARDGMGHGTSWWWAPMCVEKQLEAPLRPQEATGTQRPTRTHGEQERNRPRPTPTPPPQGTLAPTGSTPHMGAMSMTPAKGNRPVAEVPMATAPPMDSPMRKKGKASPVAGRPLSSTAAGCRARAASMAASGVTSPVRASRSGGEMWSWEERGVGGTGD
jgi:hypothetical protein